MLSNLTKREGLLAGLGLLVGALGGYVVASHYHKKRADEEIEQVKQAYIRRRNELYSEEELTMEVEKQVADKLSKPFKVEGTFGDPYLEKLKKLKYHGTPKKVDLTEVDEVTVDEVLLGYFKEQFDEQCKEPNDISEEVDMDDLPGVKEVKDRGLGKPSDTRPYIISIEEFCEDYRHYDKISVTYFEDGETLIDDAEEVISDNDLVIGDENLKHFGVGSQSDDILYVRNPMLEADFEVAREPRSYLECVVNARD